MRDYQMMSVSDLISERDAIQSELINRAEDELQSLENRRQQLLVIVGESPTPAKKARVNGVAKFRNPANPSQTWTGRGKTPKWIEGRKEDCRIPA